MWETTDLSAPVEMTNQVRGAPSFARCFSVRRVGDHKSTKSVMRVSSLNSDYGTEFLHRGSALLERRIFLFGQLDFDDLLQAPLS